jgi:hypothetical protein
VAALVSAAVLIAVFPDPLHRFLSTLVVAASLQALVYDGRVRYGIAVLTVGLAAAPFLLWRRGDAWARRHMAIVDPVAIGCAVALLAVVLVDMLVVRLVGQTLVEAHFDLFVLGWPVTAALAGLVVWLAYAVSSEHGAEPGAAEPVAAAILVALLAIVTASTPAIVAAVYVLLLAFDRRRPALVGVAAAFLVTFVTIYYYYLGLTLLQKAGVLAGAGAVCLAAAAAVRARMGSEA